MRKQEIPGLKNFTKVNGGKRKKFQEVNLLAALMRLAVDWVIYISAMGYML
jgi:hypothetical protein